MSTTSDINIIQTGEPSRSALRVAILRGAHQLLDEPIVFEDPVALPILGKALEAQVRDDPFQYNDPLSRGLRAALVVRSRAAEDELARAVQAGVKQYVVLGAGLDTFAYRNVHTAQGLMVYEVDHPSTQVWKQRQLAEAGIRVPDSMRFVPVDFERDSLGERLAASGLRMDQPTCFSWLGVTVYLEREAVINTLRFVAGMPAGSSVTFDYRAPPATLNPIERVIDDYLRRIITEEGEPWKCHFDPMQFQAELNALGFTSIKSLDAADLNARYLARRKDGLRTGGAFRVMCAGV
jgi:methyltransferase (TIGR00027 family)